MAPACNPAEGVETFDTSERETYSEEQPNALTAEEAQSFLACLREQFPQHYGMVFLGFATGLRRGPGSTSERGIAT